MRRQSKTLKPFPNLKFGNVINDLDDLTKISALNEVLNEVIQEIEDFNKSPQYSPRFETNNIHRRNSK